jgi:alkylated DNA repair dioxygenase AlkB
MAPEDGVTARPGGGRVRIVANACSMGSVGPRVVPATWAPSLFGAGTPAVTVSPAAARRDLGGGAWLELVPRWLEGPDTLFAALLTGATWSTRTVPVYGRMLAEPRLSGRLPDPPADPDPALGVLDDVRVALAGRYGTTRGPGLNLYRDGRDGVAWHGDRVARERDRDTVVAVLSLGSTRPFRLRPRGGGRSITLRPRPGDLLVMGGRCQRSWEHTVPKVGSSGPRISLTYRDFAPG